MQLVKSALPNPAKPGDTVTYSITYWNYGLAPATGFVITDDINPYLSVILPVAAPGSYDPALRRITWSIGTVAAQSTPVTVNFSVLVDEGIPRGADVTNIAHSNNTEDPADIPSNSTTVIVDVPELKLTPVVTYPNPASENSTIVFNISVRAEVTIKIFTLSGEPILTMNYDKVKANLDGATDINRGDNRVKWDLKNKSNNRVSNGVYFYRVDARTPSGEKAFFISKMAVMR
jgi:uncharacterized repeat protein (TIGR01451 family)